MSGDFLGRSLECRLGQEGGGRRRTVRTEFRIEVLSLRSTWVVLAAASSVQLEKQALAFGRQVWPGAGELAAVTSCQFI